MMKACLHSIPGGLLWALLFVFPGVSAAEALSVDDIRTPVLDLYEEPHGKRTDERPADEVALPLKVLETASNGRFRVRIDGVEYWISPAQVKTDRKHYLAAECGKVIHDQTETAGTRALGEGCEQ